MSCMREWLGVMIVRTCAGLCGWKCEGAGGGEVSSKLTIMCTGPPKFCTLNDDIDRAFQIYGKPSTKENCPVEGCTSES